MEVRKPAILVPFSPADTGQACRDVFVYLRPESNGMEVESLIMKAMQVEKLKNNVSLAYLANIPGDFISTKGLIEHHYRIRLLFAVKGKQLFTKHMKKAFKSYFRCSFEKADILGPYEAMKRLNIDEEALFKTWVDPSDMMNVNGQSIKKIQNLYVLNYDIPAILNKNNINTDIAVMIFRCCRKDYDIHFMVDAIENQLKEKGIVNPLSPSSRIFHYSKGPFEELLDSSGFLYSRELENIPLDQVAFGRFLISRGVSLEQINGAIYHPIMYFKEPDGRYTENDIYSYTRDNSYEEAFEGFERVFLQRILQ